MKRSYPSSHQISKLSDPLLTLKIARHSACQYCECSGLKPAPYVEVVLDDEETDSLLGGLDQYGSDDDDDNSAYLELCACNHTARDHNAEKDIIGRDEFIRRAKVAIRIDELLQDVGKLLDFSYVDSDVASLRLQMQIPPSRTPPSIAATPDRSGSPASSALSEPPRKKTRILSSSLSGTDDDDDDDDEENQPLATRVGKNPDRPRKASRKTGPRTSKKTGKSKAIMMPASTTVPPPIQELPGESGYQNGTVDQSPLKVKVEEKSDESQLDRLATGVTVDTSSAASSDPAPKAEKMAFVELRKGIILVTPVENDGQPRSLVILTNLKTLFQKQLPKMPREYITRLVFDSNSRSLAIIKRGYKVVGGICFRPFPHRGFAEIVFFATASVDQVKGYGGMLMDYFKMHIKHVYPDTMHFLTYADNYAVGYFTKQGFSKEITLDRSVWAGYIKDYEGGTIMQCTMLRKMDYLDKVNTIAKQREAILTKIRQKSKSHVVYPGLTQFMGDVPEGSVLDPRDVPGLRESGWNPSMAGRLAPKNAEQNLMERLIHDLQGHPQAWPYLQPVNAEEVLDYYDVIKNPMDFGTMEHRLETGQYANLDAFLADARLVFDNSRQYNPEGSVYAKSAIKLEKFLKDQLAERTKRAESIS